MNRVFLFLLSLLLGLQLSWAGSATWSAAPANGDWNSDLVAGVNAVGQWGVIQSCFKNARHRGEAARVS